MCAHYTSARFGLFFCSLQLDRFRLIYTASLKLHLLLLKFQILGRPWDSEKMEWLRGLIWPWKILAVLKKIEKVDGSCIYASILDINNLPFLLAPLYSTLIPAIFFDTTLFWFCLSFPSYANVNSSVLIFSDVSNFWALYFESFMHNNNYHHVTLASEILSKIIRYYISPKLSRNVGRWLVVII